MGKGKIVITIVSLSNISRGKDLSIFSQSSKSAAGRQNALNLYHSSFDSQEVVQ
jgi:hypothetical protein